MAFHKHFQVMLTHSGLKEKKTNVTGQHTLSNLMMRPLKPDALELLKDRKTTLEDVASGPSQRFKAFHMNFGESQAVSVKGGNASHDVRASSKGGMIALESQSSPKKKSLWFVEKS